MYVLLELEMPKLKRLYNISILVVAKKREHQYFPALFSYLLTQMGRICQSPASNRSKREKLYQIEWVTAMSNI